MILSPYIFFSFTKTYKYFIIISLGADKMQLKDYIYSMFQKDCSLRLSFSDIRKMFKTYEYTSLEEIQKIMKKNKLLEGKNYSIIKRKSLIIFQSNFFIEKFEDNIPIFKEISNKELEKICLSLEQDGLIYYDNIKKEYFSFPDNFYIVDVKSTKKGVLYFELSGERYLISHEDIIKPLLFDKIIVREINGALKIDKIINRVDSNVICEVSIVNGSFVLTPLNPSIPEDYPLQINLTNKEKKLLTNGDRVLVELSNNVDGRGKYEGVLKSHLGNKKDLNNDLQTLSLMYGFRYDFSEKSLEELENIPFEISNDDFLGREDLTEELTFSIDGRSAMDLDDAITIYKTNEGYILKVHISHVSHYIKTESALYQDALTNTSSIYFAEGVIPMFPHKISSGICSLNEQENRLTRTIEIHYDNYGNKTNFRIYKSVIRNKFKMSFEDVNQYFQNNDIHKSYLPFIDSLNIAKELSDLLGAKKIERGYLGLDSSELCFTLDECGTTVDVGVQEKGIAQDIIENFMLVSNETITEHVGALPLPHRNHGNPDPVKINRAVAEIKNMNVKINFSNEENTHKFLQSILSSVKNEEYFAIVSRIILFALGKAYYSTNSVGHFGLALDYYTHGTAPIRRIIDFIVHTLIDIYEERELTDEFVKDLYNTLEIICKLASKKERECDLLTHQVQKMNLTSFMAKNIGNIYTVYIQGFSKNGVIIRTKGLKEGIIPYQLFGNKIKNYNEKNNTLLDYDGWNHKVGHTLLVKLERVDIERQQLYYSLIKNITKDETLARREERSLARKRKFN